MAFCINDLPFYYETSIVHIRIAITKIMEKNSQKRTTVFNGYIIHALQNNNSNRFLITSCLLILLLLNAIICVCIYIYIYIYNIHKAKKLLKNKQNV